MNSDYHELMGVSRLLAAAEEKIEELEADLENAESYITELEGGEDIRHDQKLEGMLADLEQMFLDYSRMEGEVKHIDMSVIVGCAKLVEYLRSKGVVRLA